jgi:TRAP-type C4-dicarboxylate transport system permease small subunit
VHGGFEMTEMLLAGLIFSALPLVTLRGEHVTVDLLEPITPDFLFRLQHVFACLVGCVATGYLAGRLWARAVAMDLAGETTAQLKLKLAYLTYAMAILMALTALALLVLACRRPGRQQTGGA